MCLQRIFDLSGASVLAVEADKTIIIDEEEVIKFASENRIKIAVMDDEAFGLGKNEVTLAPLDTSGVALAAVKGLQAKLNEKDALIADLQNEVEELRNTLEERLQALESQVQN